MKDTNCEVLLLQLSSTSCDGWTWPLSIKYSVCAFVQVVYTKKLLPEIYSYLDCVTLADLLKP